MVLLPVDGFVLWMLVGQSLILPIIVDDIIVDIIIAVAAVFFTFVVVVVVVLDNDDVIISPYSTDTSFSTWLSTVDVCCPCCIPTSFY